MKTLTGIFTTLALGVFGVLIATIITGCGLLTSQGHFEMAGDQRGIRAVSDMMNGLANSRYEKNGYWKQRHLDTTEEAYNDRQPGFWSKLMFGGFAAKKPESEDSGS